MGGDDRAAPSDPPLEDGPVESLHRRAMKAISSLTPWALKSRIDDAEHRLGTAFEEGVDRLEGRLDTIEGRLDNLETAVRTVQDDLSATRDGRLGPLEQRTDAAELALLELTGETGRLRDQVLPAAVARADALLERLAEELEETASLVERSLLREPLPTASDSSVDETRLAEALAEIQPRLLEVFRGSEENIHHRLEGYLDDLRSSAPVLDLGCGRGELLLMLREAGIASTGVEGDPALAEAAKRRGLKIIEGDVLEMLRAQEPESWGAVTAIHLLEHLPPPVLAQVASEVRRVLRPGGLLLGECPNPHSLRVGASLFWQDPTHWRPLLPETLELFLEAAGLVVDRRLLLHPFPVEQLFAGGDESENEFADSDLGILSERVNRLGRRLDELLNGPRDFAVWARRPDETE